MEEQTKKEEQKKEIPTTEFIKIKCPLCKEQIPSNALRCSKCGGDLNNKESQKDIQNQLHDRAQASKILLIIGAIIVAFIVLVSLMSGGNSTNTTKETKITDSEAYVISQGYVKKILKSPSTADFSMFDYNFVDLGNNKYKIVSYVDSQNSFGAKIRNDYSATLSYNSGDWANINNWTLNELIFDNKVIYQESTIEQ